MNKTALSVTRNSSIECLRILAMLLIVLSHSTLHSGVEYTYGEFTINRIFFQCTDLGNLGVVIFVIISGYYLSGKTFRIQSLTKLLAQVWFYSLSLFLICRFCFGYSYTTYVLWKVFLPIIHGEYWFCTVYCLLLLFQPFLNSGIASITRRHHLALILILTMLWTVVPILWKRNVYGTDLPLFFLYYLIGAYFRKYPDNLFQRSFLRWGLLLLSVLALLVSAVTIAYLERYGLINQNETIRYFSKSSILTLGCAVGLFAIAANMKSFHNTFLNTVGGCTFGVYLIHDNPAVRDLIWKNWLYWGNYYTSGSYILRTLLSVILVFSVCTAMEYLRQKTVAKPLENLLNRAVQKFLPM